MVWHKGLFQGPTGEDLAESSLARRRSVSVVWGLGFGVRVEAFYLAPRICTIIAFFCVGPLILNLLLKTSRVQSSGFWWIVAWD